MGSPFDCIHTGGPPVAVVVVVAVLVVVVVAVAGLVLCVVATDAGGCFSLVVGEVTTDAGTLACFSAVWVAMTKAGGALPEPSPGCVLSNGSIVVVGVVVVEAVSLSLRTTVWVVVEGVKGVTMVLTVDGGL